MVILHIIYHFSFNNSFSVSFTINFIYNNNYIFCSIKKIVEKNIILSYGYSFDDIKSIIVWDEKLAIDPSATKVKDYYGRIRSSGYKKMDYFLFPSLDEKFQNEQNHPMISYQDL